MFQKERIAEAVREILQAVGEDPHREGLERTPQRVAEMYQELFSGLHQDPVEELSTMFEEGHQDMVIVRDIPFASLCEHHLLPFFGTADIGYLPKGWIVGASKVARALEVLARRPQLQERLTNQLADSLVTGLKPEGVAVVIKAEHLCMTMRGVKKQGSSVVTSATRGLFQSSTPTREEFLSLVQGH